MLHQFADQIEDDDENEGEEAQPNNPLQQGGPKSPKVGPDDN